MGFARGHFMDIEAIKANLQLMNELMGSNSIDSDPRG